MAAHSKTDSFGSFQESGSRPLPLGSSRAKGTTTANCFYEDVGEGLTARVQRLTAVLDELVDVFGQPGRRFGPADGLPTGRRGHSVAGHSIGGVVFVQHVVVVIVGGAGVRRVVHVDALDAAARRRFACRCPSFSLSNVLLTCSAARFKLVRKQSLFRECSFINDSSSRRVSPWNL